MTLFGSLSPHGAILRRAAAIPDPFERERRAVVFESQDDLSARLDSPKLDVTAEDFLVFKNAGPGSPSCMPAAGYLPIPSKLAQTSVKDMVRISAARMSGTAYGRVVSMSARMRPPAAIWRWCATRSNPVVRYSTPPEAACAGERV